MIYIFHGEDANKSRRMMDSLREKLNISVKVEYKINDLGSNKLLDLIKTPDIFGEFPFIILDFTEAGKTNLTEHFDILLKNTTEANVAIYSSKNIPQSNIFIKESIKLKVKIYKNDKIPQGNIFRFIDHLYSQKRNETYKEFAKLLEENDPFYINSMLHYGLKNIALIKFETESAKKISPYSKSKFIKISGLYSEDTIKSLYDYFYSIEKKIKTGRMSPENGITLYIEKVLNSC